MGMVGGWLASPPGRPLPPTRDLPVTHWIGLDPDPVWTQMLKRKIIYHARDRTTVVHSVASHYTGLIPDRFTWTQSVLRQILDNAFERLVTNTGESSKKRAVAGYFG